MNPPPPQGGDLPPARVRLPRPWLTILLIVAILVVFALQLASGQSAMDPTAQELLASGGNLGPLTFGGEPWRLVSSMFLHGGALHLGLNLVCLWSGGALAERLYGRAGLAAIYVVAGLGGGLASALTHANTVSVGASGAIFGVFGAVGAYVIAHRARIDPAAYSAQLKNLAVFVGINVALGMSQPQIDMSAHVGGLLIGFGLGLGFELGGRSSFARRAVLTGVALATIGGLVIAVPTPAPPGGRAAELFEEFDRLEARSVARYAELSAANASGAQGDPAVATAIETELIAPADALRLQLLGATDIPSRLEAVQLALERVVHARIALWRQLVLALRGNPDEAALQRLGEQVQAAIRRADQELTKLR